MDYDLCKRFDTLRTFLPDDLITSTSKDIHTLGNIKNYCPSEGSGGTKECKTDFDKIQAGCLWLFEQLFVKNKNKIKNINVVGYIMIWLSYMLSIKKESEVTNLNDFYSKHIEINTYYTNCDNNGQDCGNLLKEITGYKNYKEIIDTKNELLNINFEHVPKLYDAFKSLCIMYTEISTSDRKDKKYLENAKKFVNKYNELNNPNNTKDSPYYQVLSTLSNDYNNFKNYCNKINDDCSDIPPLPEIKTTQDYVQDSGQTPVQNSEATSSSLSITNKLIPVLSIIVAIPIFLGIFYKYSLFGFRKRPQKQHLREKSEIMFVELIFGLG
ncbi:putative yir1 protein, partial [Plasmodium yoelii yoelii]